MMDNITLTSRFTHSASVQHRWKAPHTHVDHQTL